jgi:hypothetical protein
MLQNSAPRNVVAGSQVNLDEVVAHYKQQYLAEEERKALKLSARKGD